MTEQQLLDLDRYQDSDAFSPLERRVLDLAVEMAKTPVAVPDDLMSGLREQLGQTGLVELVATIAWENYRARFNRPFKVEAVGFSAGGVCAVPHVPPASG